MIFNHSANIKLHKGTVTGNRTGTHPPENGDDSPVQAPATGYPLQQDQRYTCTITRHCGKANYIVPRTQAASLRVVVSRQRTPVHQPEKAIVGPLRQVS